MNGFNNLKIGKKLLTSTVLLMTLIVLTGGAALYGFKYAQARLQTVYADRLLPALDLGYIAELMSQNVSALQLAGRANPVFGKDKVNAHLTTVRGNIAEISRVWDGYMATYLTPEEKALAEEYAAKRKKFVQEGLLVTMEHLSRGIAAGDEAEFEEADIQISKVALPLYAEAIAVNKKLRELQTRVGKEEMDAAQAFATLFQWGLAGVAALTLLGLLISLRIARSVTQPVNQLAEMLGTVESTGDFSHRMNLTGQDEIGLASAAMDRLLTTLQAAITEANQVVGDVAAGRFKSRVKADFKGDLLTLKEGVNGSAQSVDFTMQELGKVMQALYHGDFSARMDGRVEAGFRKMVEDAMTAMQDSVGGILEVMEMMQEGRFQHRVEIEARGDLKRLKEGVNESMNALEAAIQEVTRVVTAQAEGNLTLSITGNYHGELATLKDAINATTIRLGEIVAEIRGVSDAVSSAADEVSRGAQDLNNRTQEMASALEETAASMEEMAATVKSNTDSAHQANQLASRARGEAEDGSGVAVHAVAAMQSITDSSRKIVDIITLIDGIAFQTNILALNAAVEAARAGEHGRGFAVVASEVRFLAQKAADASKEIKGLIENSAANVEEGSTHVGRTGEVLDGINDAIRKVSEIVSEIASASAEQGSGIGQINKAVTGLDNVTQQNAALVEETSAAAESLSRQAQNLQQLMGFFRVEPARGGEPSGLSAKPLKVASKAVSKVASKAVSKASSKAFVPAATSAVGDEEWVEF